MGAPAVVIHLHEVGLGLLVDLRPTDPNLAIDKPFFLTKWAQMKPWPGGRGGGVLGWFWALFIEALLSLLGRGRGGGHGHTQPSSEKNPSSYGKGEGW